MARFAGGEHIFDNRPLHAMMSGIAAGFADADLELAGTDLVAFRNRPHEALPEKVRLSPLPGCGSEHHVSRKSCFLNWDEDRFESS